MKWLPIGSRLLLAACARAPLKSKYGFNVGAVPKAVGATTYAARANRDRRTHPCQVHIRAGRNT